MSKKIRIFVLFVLSAVQGIQPFLETAVAKPLTPVHTVEVVKVRTAKFS